MGVSKCMWGPEIPGEAVRRCSHQKRSMVRGWCLDLTHAQIQTQTHARTHIQTNERMKRPHTHTDTCTHTHTNTHLHMSYFGNIATSLPLLSCTQTHKCSRLKLACKSQRDAQSRHMKECLILPSAHMNPFHFYETKYHWHAQVHKTHTHTHACMHTSREGKREGKRGGTRGGTRERECK